jgi:DNA modification methylase
MTANTVYHGDSLDLLRSLPSAVDAVVTDGMYGTGDVRYDWGCDPGRGDPLQHWKYHEPIYRECLRVLKPGSILAWAVGVGFIEHFRDWFGPHGLWPLPRRSIRTANWIHYHLWVVQTKERKPIPLTTNYKLIEFDALPPRHVHPCPKPVEEMAFLIQALTQPGDLILDCFAGLGATLVAAKLQGRRYIGCDKSYAYAKWAAEWLKKQE